MLGKLSTTDTMPHYALPRNLHCLTTYPSSGIDSPPPSPPPAHSPPTKTRPIAGSTKGNTTSRTTTLYGSITRGTHFTIWGLDTKIILLVLVVLPAAYHSIRKVQGPSRYKYVCPNRPYVSVQSVYIAYDTYISRFEGDRDRALFPKSC